MKFSYTPLPTVAFLAAITVFSAVASAQPKLPSESDPSINGPADNGMVKKPDPSSMRGSSNSGMVVVPPVVDPGAVKTPPKNIDPEITGATKDIDRQNRKKSEDKKKLQ